MRLPEQEQEHKEEHDHEHNRAKGDEDQTGDALMSDDDQLFMDNDFDAGFDAGLDHPGLGDSDLDDSGDGPPGFAVFDNNNVHDVGEDDDRRDCIDIDQLIQRIDLYDAEVTALPMNLDLQEIQQADQYDDETLTAPTDPELDAIPTTSFSEVDTDTNVEIPTEQAFWGNDKSEPIPQLRSNDMDPSPFAVALGLWCDEAGISRPLYVSLLEILRMPELATDVHSLPACVSTLKKQTIAHLPLIAMRKRKIALQSAQQSRHKTEEDLIFFDPIDLFTKFLASNITKTMHLQMGEFHDAHQQDELYKSQSWTSSIRSTSGDFAHFHTGQPIFPSDIVTFRCLDLQCGACSNTGTRLSAFSHLGRVLGVGRDFRSDAVYRGHIVVKVQELLSQQQLGEYASVFKPPLDANERVLSWNNVSYCRESSIGQRVVDVALDYTFQDIKIVPRPLPPVSGTAALLIRRIIDFGSTPPTVTPLCLNHPIRGELEIQAFGRTHLETLDRTWSCRNRSTGPRRTLSIPLLTFIDGFGLYRNAYRTLMGFYFIFAGLSFHERARRANVLPFTLGPHGSNFSDVLMAIRCLAALERGIEVQLPGIPGTVILVAYTLAFIGDMPQQQKNSGMKTQRALLGCRMCFIDSEQRGELSYDTFLDGRYHHTVIAMREDLDALPTKKEREDYGTEWGMDPDPLSMTLHNTISPALDIITSRPGDPSHSEFQGLSNMLHNLLLESVLTPKATKEYAAVLRSFPFPPSWPRVQGPLHHLKSYSMSEHARWSIVVPLLLRCWLREKHIRVHLLNVLRAPANGIADPTNYIISQFASATRSNSVLMSQTVSPQDRHQMADIVYGYRSQLQQLLSALAQSMAVDKRRAPRRAGSTAGSTAGSVASSRAGSVDVSDAGSQVSQIGSSGGGAAEQGKKAAAYESHMKKPNMHVAIHYAANADEYGLPVNVNVLVGEDKHRCVYGYELEKAGEV